MYIGQIKDLDSYGFRTGTRGSVRPPSLARVYIIGIMRNSLGTEMGWWTRLLRWFLKGPARADTPSKGSLEAFV